MYIRTYSDNKTKGKTLTNYHVAKKAAYKSK